MWKCGLVNWGWCGGSFTLLECLFTPDAHCASLPAARSKCLAHMRTFHNYCHSNPISKIASSLSSQAVHSNVPTKFEALGDQDQHQGILGHCASPMPSSNVGPIGATIHDMPALGPAPIPMDTQESQQMLNQDQLGAPSTVDCLVPTGSEPIPAVPKPAVPPPVAPPHSPEQHAEVLRMFQKYGLDPYSETWIRDATSERHSRSVIRNHMEMMYMGADKESRNSNNLQWLNIQIASVSHHLLTLA